MSSEKKSTAEGDLGVTSKDLDADVSTLSDLHAQCMRKAQDFEAETKSRSEELHALAEAKKVISEAAGGADKISYGLDQVSFVQLAGHSKDGHFVAVRFVRDLARKQHSSALAQLASRMASTIRV